MDNNITTLTEAGDIDECSQLVAPNNTKLAGLVFYPDAVFIYLISLPIVLTVGSVGNIISIIAMYKQFKLEQVYFLQLLIFVSDFISCLLLLLFCVLTTYLWRSYPGPNWVKSNLLLTSYTTYLVTPMANMIANCSLILTAITGLDRLQGMVAPSRYKNVNHKKRSIAAGSFSFIVGVASSVHDCWRQKVVYCSAFSSYEAIYRVPTTLQTILELARTSFRVVVVVVIIITTSVTCVVYQRVEKKRQQMNAGNRDETTANNPISSRVLTKLFIVQSILIVVGFVPLCSWYIYFYVLKPLGVTISATTSQQLSNTINATLCASCSLTFVIYLMTSRRFRSVVVQLFKKPNVVEQISTNKMSQSVQR